MIVRVITGRHTDDEAVFDAVAKAWADRAVTSVIVHRPGAEKVRDNQSRTVDLSKRPEPLGGC